MPQITVQYPAALAVGFDRRGFALAVHAAASDLISSALEGFKTRFLVLDETVVGDGNPNYHMLHAIVEILPGRPEELKTRLGKLVLGLLEAHLTIPSAYSVQVTTEIRELHGYHQRVLP
ncbi:5-carboxymethyl-2-hydroxymuconate Delta-isomerase [Saccharopolyspora sp. NPDC000995]